MITEVAARHFFFFQTGWGEICDNFSEQGVGPFAVIAAEITDVNIECDAAHFRPGVYGQMRLSQNNRAGDAGGFAGSILKGVEQAANDAQAMPLASVHAKNFECRRVEQKFGQATAVIEIGNQVQAIHRLILGRFT